VESQTVNLLEKQSPDGRGRAIALLLIETIRDPRSL
jgi:hypothetical protein